MRTQAARIGDPRSEDAQVGRMLNLPPSYLLIHRVTLGSIAVLCQLGATAPYRALAERWQPGFAEPATPLAAERSPPLVSSFASIERTYWRVQVGQTQRVYGPSRP